MEDEKLTLINKVVKVIDTSAGIDNTGIISFMYPDFIPKDEIFFDYENNILFTGRYKYGVKEELEHGTKNFIALSSTGIYDVDFTIRETIVKVLYGKWGKDVPEAVLDDIKSMNDSDFWDYFKKFWILGRSKIDDSGKKLYELHSVLGKQRHDILKTYFELREVYSDSTIFSSVLGFIEKSLNPEQVSSNNGIYLSTLKKFSEEYGDKVIPIVRAAYVMKGDSAGDKEYRTLWMLMQLGKGNII